jgi:hypothetical protein
MAVNKPILETIEYRLALVQPDSCRVLALDAIAGYCLPSVRVPKWTRQVTQLQKAINASWGLHVLVLDFLDAQNNSPCLVVAEVLIPDAISELRPVTLEKIPSSELSEQQRAQLVALLAGATNTAVSQIGWIDQAIKWLELETKRRLSSKSEIEQHNAGGAFSLIRFHMEDETDYWLKATGEPNVHELSITKILSELGGANLPQLISVRPAWNAWLMSGDAIQVGEVPKEPYKLFRFLEGAVESMADLQIKTQGHSLDLLGAGVFDQGFAVLEKHSEALFDYLEAAMSRQTSTRVPRLERSRLQEIRKIFDEVCCRAEDLNLPKTIVHGDLNWGNILIGGGRCQFIDWCEAYLGNPLISLQHLLLLNKMESLELTAFSNRLLKDRYRTIWLGSCSVNSLDRGFAYMPLLAVASTLFGRGDWLASPRRRVPDRHAYARGLARHMDRISREPELLEALCR